MYHENALTLTLTLTLALSHFVGEGNKNYE
jgi:hypothetical protein